MQFLKIFISFLKVLIKQESTTNCITVKLCVSKKKTKNNHRSAVVLLQENRTKRN